MFCIALRTLHFKSASLAYILHDDGDAMQRASDLTVLPLKIELFSDAQGVWVALDHSPLSMLLVQNQSIQGLRKYLKR